jgi:hypothetical protein
LPFTGGRKRDNGLMDYQNSGRYWFSSPLGVNSVNAYRLYFISVGVRQKSSDKRAYGYSVRCFKN